MAKVTTLVETQAAQAFLKLIGASTTDAALVASVVTWYKIANASATHPSDPFNLKPGAWDVVYRNGTTQTQTGTRWVENDDGSMRLVPLYQQFSTYASMKTALQGVASFILYNKTKYAGILYALKLGDVTRLFQALTLSDFDASSTKLWALFKTYTGITLPPGPVPAPPAPIPAVVPTSVKAPVPVRVIRPPVIVRNFIDPYQAARFYRARHPLPEVT